MNPEIDASVVVLSYDRVHLLERTLKACLKPETAPGVRFEIIVVDNHPDRLAQGLHAVGHAPDGLVEAFEIVGAKAFACAVQWHPEWKAMSNDFSRALFGAFGDACRARAGARRR